MNTKNYECLGTDPLHGTESVIKPNEIEERKGDLERLNMPS